MKKSFFDRSTQVILPVLTSVGFALTSFKRPDLGLIVSFIAQIFWLYAGWVAWRKAGQVGIFISALIITVIVFYGILNYWILH